MFYLFYSSFGWAYRPSILWSPQKGFLFSILVEMAKRPLRAIPLFAPVSKCALSKAFVDAKKWGLPSTVCLEQTPSSSN